MKLKWKIRNPIALALAIVTGIGAIIAHPTAEVIGAVVTSVIAAFSGGVRSDDAADVAAVNSSLVKAGKLPVIVPPPAFNPNIGPR